MSKPQSPSVPSSVVLSDTVLLDWLESLPNYDDYKRWKLRRSTTGRGWRLLTTREEPNYATPREALIAALEKCRQELNALDHIIGEGDGGE